MSHTHLSFHGCATATARVGHVNSTHWLTLAFVDAKGTNLEVTLYNDQPEALLAQLLAGSVETIQLEAYAEGRADQCEADEETCRSCDGTGEVGTVRHPGTRCGACKGGAGTTPAALENTVGAA